MEDTMTYAAKTGYDCLEIAPFTISNYVTDISATERQRVKDLATKTGIEISGIHWALVKAEGMHMTYTDASIREKTARYRGPCGLPLISAVAPSSSARHMRNFYARELRASVGMGHRRVQRQRQACRRARCGDQLRTAGPSETNFVNIYTEAIQFVQQLESPTSR